MATRQWISDPDSDRGNPSPSASETTTRFFPPTLPAIHTSTNWLKELVAHTDYSLNEANIRDCLHAYQQVAPLTIAELWSFPLLLRMALIEALARLALQVSRKAAVARGSLFLGESPGRRLTQGTGGVRADPPSHGSRAGRTRALLPDLPGRATSGRRGRARARTALDRRAAEDPLTEMVRTEHTREAAERISTANAFGSLRALARIDFAEIFESASLVEAELRTDPSGTYAHSDFATRDRCRRVVERISRYSGVGELDVARRAVSAGQTRHDSRTQHVGLLSAGRRRHATGSRNQGADTIRNSANPRLATPATAVYLGGIAGLTLCFTALALALAWDAGVRQPAMLAVLGVLALFPLSELAIQIVNALVISLLPPEPLPKMDFREGIPPEHATLVVVPMMLSSLEVVRREIEKLEVRFLANQESASFL